jgi:hypothetical protein
MTRISEAGMWTMKLSEYLKAFHQDLVEWSLSGMGEIKFPFETTGNNFLNYAERDLERNDTAGNVNALTNAKRAIDCQVEALIKALGLKREQSFPKKLERIKEIGLVAPRILNKVNKTRNLLEHEFKNPERSQVEDAVDIATLFVKLTNGIFLNFIHQADFEESYDSLDLSDKAFELGKTARGMRIYFEEQYSGFLVEGFDRDKQIMNYKVVPGMPEHLPLMKLFVHISNSDDNPIELYKQLVGEVVA